MRVYYYNLPVSVKGYIVEDADGYHSILLNSRYTKEANLETYQHELKHISHFQEGGVADSIEAAAHEKKKEGFHGNK